MRLLRIPEPFDHPDFVFELKLDGFLALATTPERPETPRRRGRERRSGDNAVRWRANVDIAGFLLAIGYMAIATWLLVAERHWAGVLSLVFSVWWAWHTLHDRPVKLDIRNAPADPAPTDAGDVAPFGGGACCFCGGAIPADSDDWCHVSVEHRGDFERWQFWLCHGSCFKARLARPTDAPDLFKSEFL